MLKLPFYMLRRLGFNETRVIWIKGCLASSSVSILINGRPTKEFMLQKGLRQGDPLAPFLFNIVGKGLSGLMRETTSKNLFSGFKVGKNNVEVNLLQYVDDTIYIGEMSLNNVVVIKSIMLVALLCRELLRDRTMW